MKSYVYCVLQVADAMLWDAVLKGDDGELAAAIKLHLSFFRVLATYTARCDPTEPTTCLKLVQGGYSQAFNK